MKTPKYKIGQKVWIIVNNKITEKKILGIITVNNQFYNEIFSYQFDSINDFNNKYQNVSVADFLHEDRLFETRESLINSI